MTSTSHHPVYSPATTVVAAGRPEHLADNPLNAPLVLASNFVAGGELEYARDANPTWQAFEQVLGELEGGRALAFASGMAAATTILDLVSHGETVVAPRHCYNMVLAQLRDREQRGLVRLRLVDVTEPGALAAACEDAALVWLESPTNPAMEVIDLPAVITAAHDAGATVVVDNTFATPLLQRPLESGADIVLHSASKYLSGHSDLVLGAVVVREDPTYDALEARRISAGAIPGPFETWLALRGIRTLALRVERAQANAQELARRLQAHPAIAEVRYPGFGAMLAVVLHGGPDRADALTHATKLWIHATSLGGVESTFERRRRWTAEPSTIPESLVRMSVGIEDVDDLWLDLEQALDSLA